ncbi:uncharacterized protein F5147DRAFT_780186 [Suillus discolor]|uniref:Uncharacterized protein n=1 Tax=Suillus discolor TaxID=1912936 RepID=A0A9P7ETY8_9AGAM|nr:uncharacterized protein F5147DRAFT_780186 [Suillus discolor]KAG2090918.1 hypothetical protein F5147DRAFT_780186 [Suillus discolor]
MAMLLDPSQKDSHIKRFWGKETHIDALREAERMFKERHVRLYGEHGAPNSPRKKTGKVHLLLRELSSDDESDNGELEESLVDPQSP